MRERRLLDLLTMRPLTVEDLPGRVNMMNDPQVLRNITSLPALYDDERLTAYFTELIGRTVPDRLEFVLTRPDGPVVAYTYLMGIDWPNRTCEIGMATVPCYRFGFGLVALLKTYEHAFGTLNMRSVMNEVYDGNQMMTGTDDLARRAEVRSSDAQFTNGQVRDTFVWTQTQADYPRYFGQFLNGAPSHADR